MKILNIVKINKIIKFNKKFYKNVKVFFWKCLCFDKIRNYCDFLLVVLEGLDCIVFGLIFLIMFYVIRFVVFSYL